MIYDIKDIVGYGRSYPPKEEIKRLDGYRVNALLMDDEAWSAMPEYTDRVKNILANFAIPDQDVYLYSANYWSDLVAKTQELTYGEPPEIAVENKDELVADILTKTEFIEKAKEGCADFVGLGDWVTKIVEDEEGNKTFINVNPATWFPVVSRENIKDIKAHVLSWVVTVTSKRYELHVQIHEKGSYTNKAFKLENYNPDSYYTVAQTNQRINIPTYDIGSELSESAIDGFNLGTFETGLDDFAIVASANNPGTRRICGVSDFDNITSAVMEYCVRMTLKGIVLDKHSAPKMFGAPLVGDGTGMGNYLEVPPGGTTPNYLVWDASMQAVENTIYGLKDDIANLSGMGSLLSSKTFGESQGYDALMIKLAPALMRAAGKKVVLEKHIKKLIHLLSKNYGEEILEKDISVMWHDGIPATESVKADIAQKHLNTGWSQRRVLMQDYGFDENTADEIVEERRLETPAIPSFGVDEEDYTGDDGDKPTE